MCPPHFYHNGYIYAYGTKESFLLFWLSQNKTFSTNIQIYYSQTDTYGSWKKCPLLKSLDFFEEKIIIDKNLTRFYVNCDTWQLHLLKNIWIVLCLTYCNLSVSTYPINSFSIMLICLSPWISAKHLTASRISRALDAVTFLIPC